METLDNNLSNGENLIINGQIKSHLLETAKWGRILAILGFVGLGLMIILLIFGVSMFNTILSQQPMQTGASLGGGSMTISFVFSRYLCSFTSSLYCIYTKVLLLI
ncbi:MAG: hypothetical protein IPO24_07830 [Bacteroidetes bacterium]|nr:hypothetical protein [Bacteroidota bacterium]